MAPDNSKDTPIEEMSFEQAIAELEGIVGKLEQGDVALDESISIYERGETLKRHCENQLAAAEKRVEKIRLDANGQATGTEPLDS
ncbi:MAG: exodeoxyribonuclease VII small subunit [Pseudomonadota bacterium]